MDKQLKLKDKLGILKDPFKITHSTIRTKVQMYSHDADKPFTTDTGELLWTRHNRMILAGGGFLARALFNITDPEKTPTYNTMLGLHESNMAEDFTKEKVVVFCVGTGGCGREASQVYESKYASWINPNYTDDYGGIVPFRYATADELPKISTGDPNINGSYFGKKYGVGANGDRTAFYFKRFDSEPIFTQQFQDGTPIDANVYTAQETSDSEVETTITLQLSITKDDCRDFFLYGSGLNDARINEISLCSAYYDTSANDYTFIRPITRITFPNESLIDLRKSLTVIYTLYL